MRTTTPLRTLGLIAVAALLSAAACDDGNGTATEPAAATFAWLPIAAVPPERLTMLPENNVTHGLPTLKCFSARPPPVGGVLP